MCPLDEYYIELPQTTVALMAGNNQAYNLTTWHGPANPKLMSCDTFKTTIIEIALQEGPIDLQPAGFGSTSARANGVTLRALVDKKIMKLTYLTICKTLFTALCPDYSNQPHAALDLIKQVSFNRDGNQVVASVYIYYKRLMNAARPFTSE